MLVSRQERVNFITSMSGSGREVMTTRYCISRHVKAGFASKASAQTPAASGADADVPVWLSVQMWSDRSRAS